MDCERESRRRVPLTMARWRVMWEEETLVKCLSMTKERKVEEDLKL